MNRAVLDTNVLVSGLLSPGGPPATLLDEIAAGNLTPVYSDPIFEEYAEVLLRPALRLDPDAVLELLLLFGKVAEYISPGNDTLYGVDHADFPDMDDLPFYAAALAESVNRRRKPTGAPNKCHQIRGQDAKPVHYWVRGHQYRRLCSNVEVEESRRAA